MTETEQRIAIAEWCGWKWAPGKVIEFGADIPRNIWYAPSGLACKSGPPDYLNDLNAMHEAVLRLRELDAKLYIRYHQELIKIDGLLYPDATAAQRAEALLRTIGKWKE